MGKYAQLVIGPAGCGKVRSCWLLLARSLARCGDTRECLTASPAQRSRRTARRCTTTARPSAGRCTWSTWVSVRSGVSPRSRGVLLAQCRPYAQQSLAPHRARRPPSLAAAALPPRRPCRRALCLPRVLRHPRAGDAGGRGGGVRAGAQRVRRGAARRGARGRSAARLRPAVAACQLRGGWALPWAWAARWCSAAALAAA
jgi:hypothetical protein